MTGQQTTTGVRRLSMLERMEQLARRKWLNDERTRHEPFVRALQDPSRAADVIRYAFSELERWENDLTRTDEEIAGWRAVLSLPAEKIAALLTEQGDPVLQRQDHESPFREPNNPQDANFRLEMLARRQQTRRDKELKAMMPFPRLRSAKRQLSLVTGPEPSYPSPMAHPDLSHPGEYVREQCLERFHLSVTEGARVLGVSRQALTNLVTGKAGISPEMALRLDLAFGGGAETWLQRQLVHDLALARRRLDQLKVVSVTSERQVALF